MYLWLTDRSASGISFARTFLLGYSQPASAHVATDYGGNWVGFTASGLAHVYRGPTFFGTSGGDPRVPDLVGIAQHGVVYTGGTAKIAEHGGADAQDRHVALVAFGAGESHGVVWAPVETTQIAPTILSLLGLDPHRLDAVRREHISVLPAP